MELNRFCVVFRIRLEASRLLMLGISRELFQTDPEAYCDTTSESIRQSYKSRISCAQRSEFRISDAENNVPWFSDVGDLKRYAKRCVLRKFRFNM